VKIISVNENIPDFNNDFTDKDKPVQSNNPKRQINPDKLTPTAD